jgi:hypothetical protein
MKRLLLPAVLALLPAVASADIGLGASLRDSDPTLYLPIEPDEILRIEPFFAWSDQDVSGPVDVSTESLTIGVGLFRKLEIHDRTRVYFGARVGFSQLKQTSSDPAAADLDGDGYAIEPTLGIEYRIVDQVAVSFEALLYYHSFSEGIGAADFDRDVVGTSNQILLRAYFPP